MKPGGSMMTIRRFRQLKALVTRNSFLTLWESRALRNPVRSSSAIRGVCQTPADLVSKSNGSDLYAISAPTSRSRFLQMLRSFYSMIETEKKQERILLVGVELQGMDNFDMSMEELASLAKTAGGDVRGSLYTKAGEIRHQDLCRLRKTRRNRSNGRSR